MPDITKREICRNTYLFTEHSVGLLYNSTVILTEAGPIIIDVFRDSEQFLVISDFISSEGFATPAAIIYTHWHTDHTCGNQTFTTCPVYAHQATLAHLQSFIAQDLNRLIQKGILEAGTNPVLPTHTFSTNYKITIGDRKLELIHCPGHTYDSTLVFDRENKLLISGDTIISEEVVFFLPPVIPPDSIDAKPSDLLEAYSSIEALKPDKIIPGHGTTLNTTQLLSVNRKMYQYCLTNNVQMYDPNDV